MQTVGFNMGAFTCQVIFLGVTALFVHENCVTVLSLYVPLVISARERALATDFISLSPILNVQLCFQASLSTADSVVLVDRRQARLL